MKTWIVVAESSRAKIYELNKRHEPLRELADLVHPEARLHETAITADMPGRNVAGDGISRHALADPTPAGEYEAAEFAREVADYLERGRNEGKFERLMIAAAPGFLGQLRKAMSGALRQHVIKEIDKHLLRVDAEMLKAYFF